MRTTSNSMNTLKPKCRGTRIPASGQISLPNQKGVTLIELMVGIAIGLLVIAVAMGALMVSRGVSGTVSDASNIQQQAAYAMRVIGMQARQAGSLRINLDAGGGTKTESPFNAPIAIEIAPSAQSSASSSISSFDATDAKSTIYGDTSPTSSDSFEVGYRRYTEPVFIDNTAEQSLSRNCLGGPADSSLDQRINNIFWVDTDNMLRCAGNQELPLPPPNGAGQPLLRNVANFQVRYLLQDNTTTPGTPKISKVDATAVTNWARVQAVEVCMVLFGSEPIDLPAGSTYTDCDGATLVDMSTLTGTRAKRMHMVFRNVFQLRSQGLIGTVL